MSGGVRAAAKHARHSTQHNNTNTQTNLLEQRHHVGGAHVGRPVPGRVAGVVARVHLGAELQQQRRALDPALEGGAVQRRDPRGVDLVDVGRAAVDEREQRCVGVFFVVLFGRGRHGGF